MAGSGDGPTVHRASGSSTALARAWLRARTPFPETLHDGQAVEFLHGREDQGTPERARVNNSVSAAEPLRIHSATIRPFPRQKSLHGPDHAKRPRPVSSSADAAALGAFKKAALMIHPKEFAGACVKPPGADPAFLATRTTPTRSSEPQAPRRRTFAAKHNSPAPRSFPRSQVLSSSEMRPSVLRSRSLAAPPHKAARSRSCSFSVPPFEASECNADRCDDISCRTAAS